MSHVGAYTEIAKWEKPPLILTPGGRVVVGAVEFQKSDGLEVTWEEEPPEKAQVYLGWVPVVYGVWEE